MRQSSNRLNKTVTIHQTCQSEIAYANKSHTRRIYFCMDGLLWWKYKIPRRRWRRSRASDQTPPPFELHTHRSLCVNNLCAWGISLTKDFCVHKAFYSSCTVQCLNKRHFERSKHSIISASCRPSFSKFTKVTVAAVEMV